MPELDIRIKAGTDETKTAQIFNQIASAILAGKFNGGDALASERALAEQLGVSRNIVRNAYRRLEEEGLVETAGTAGRRVRVRRGARRATGGANVESEDRAASRLAPKGGRAPGRG